MSLTGWFFPSALAGLSVAAFAGLVIMWSRLAGNQPVRVAGRAGLLLGVNLLAVLTAFAVLNAQFLFFADWSDLTGAVGATSGASQLQRGGTALGAATAHVAGTGAQAGRILPPIPLRSVSKSGVISHTVTGRRSG